MSDKKRNPMRIESPAEIVERLRVAADAISSRHRMLREASRVDSKTKERRDYWGELSLWNDRNTGKLIVEAKVSGLIGVGGKESQEKRNAVSLTELLCVDQDKAENLSRTAQKLAKPEEAAFEAAIEKIKEAGEEVSRAAKVGSGSTEGQGCYDASTAILGGVGGA